MTITVMLLLLSLRKIEQKEIPLQIAPQVVAPLSLEEYKRKPKVHKDTLLKGKI